MPFIIPNQTGSTLENARQAQPDQKDFEILALGLVGTGVVSGCAVTQQTVADMTVKVASGVARYQNGADITVAADTSVTIEAADGTNPRFDYVMVNSADGTVVNPTAGDGKGTAAANPVFPAIPANRIILAVVHVTEAETAIEDKHIVDKSVALPSSGGGGGGTPLAIIHKDGANVALGTGTQSGTLDLSTFTTAADTDSIVDIANDKFTIKTAGVYIVHGTWETTLGTVPSDGTYFDLRIDIAGQQRRSREGAKPHGEDNPPTPALNDAGNISNVLTFVVDLAVNDDITFKWETDAPAAVDKNLTRCRFSVVKVGSV